MAIKDISKKPYIVDNDTNVKVGIDLPIRRGDDLDGFFATTSTTIEAVKNNIRNLLNTHRGERVFQPNLGLNLRRLLFEHITSDNLLGVQNAILDQLELWLKYQQHWCEHKPSITITVRDHEWMEVGAWVYKHFDEVSGISFLPHSEHTYVQAPYQEIEEDDYESIKDMPKISWENLSNFEKEDQTKSTKELACSSDACEIVDIS